MDLDLIRQTKYHMMMRAIGPSSVLPISDNVNDKNVLAEQSQLILQCSSLQHSCDATQKSIKTFTKLINVLINIQYDAAALRIVSFNRFFETS